MNALLYKLRNLPALWRSLWAMAGGEIGSYMGSLTMYGTLEASVTRFLTYIPEYGLKFGMVEDFGLLSARSVTDAGVAFLVDDWDNNGQDITTLNFHGCGIGTNAENVTDVALQTESTTALNPDSTRATGTRSQPAANQYRSVGTLTFDNTAAVTEHGIFSTSGTGTGTLWDRSVFSAINVASGDSIQFTYTLTVNSGG